MKRFSLFVCMAVLLLLVVGIPATASPAITSISPATAPNNGVVTVTITGTGFNSQSTVWLNKPYSTDPFVYGTILSRSPTSITCTFSLQGQTPTDYNVWVNSPFTDSYGNYFPEDVALLTLGFKITQGTGTTVTTTVPIPANGSITVSSIPSGANVYLDNEYKGLTPLTVKNVENGNHILLVRYTGYQDWTQNVAVLGNTQAFSARLVVIPATTTAAITAATVTTTIPAPVATARTTAPLGIELGIIATIGAAVLLTKRR
jgi:PEGA domain/IPT/TIG domain